MFNPWLLMVPFVMAYSTLPYILYYSKITVKNKRKDESK